MAKQRQRKISAAGKKWINKQLKEDQKSSRKSLEAAWHQRVDRYNHNRKMIYKQKQAKQDSQPPTHDRKYQSTRRRVFTCAICGNHQTFKWRQHWNSHFQGAESKSEPQELQTDQEPRQGRYWWEVPSKAQTPEEQRAEAQSRLRVRPSRYERYQTRIID